MSVYAGGMVWGEGPRWHDGALWLSDTQGGKLWTNASGEWSATPVDSTSNGLWFLPDGRLVGAMMHERRLAVWRDGAWETYVDLAPLGVGPLGDMVGDEQGNLYVDDVGFNAPAGETPKPGRIVLVRPDGGATVAAEDVEFPNGLAIIEDGRTLVVAETFRQRLRAFDIGPDGRLERPRTFADVADLLGPDARPDGIWPAADGVWVATTAGTCVALIAQDRLLATIDTSPGMPIACCLRDDGDLIVTVADTSGLPLMEAIAQKAVATTAQIFSPPSPHLHSAEKRNPS